MQNSLGCSPRDGFYNVEVKNSRIERHLFLIANESHTNMSLAQSSFQSFETFGFRTSRKLGGIYSPKLAQI